MPNGNSQQKSSPDAHICHQQLRANRKAWAALLRVRTEPECLEGNLRELTWDSNPNCGIAREREEKKKKKKERTVLQKALTWCTARPPHRTKDWVDTTGELAGYRLAHPPLEAGKQAGNSQSQKARGKLSHRDGIPNQTANGLPVANHYFWGFWMVDIHQEGCRQRSAPQNRHAAHLRWAHLWPPRKLSGWDWEGDKTHSSPGETVLAKHLVTWTARTWEGHKTQAQVSLHLCGVPKNLNLTLSNLHVGSARNTGLA